VTAAAPIPETTDYAIRFGGIQRLYGAQGAERLRHAHVCVIGVGGVGSWTVEALARTGIGSLTLIDLDEVCASNINRQLPALTAEIGRPKVRVLAERAAQINPECRVRAIEEFFTAASAENLLAGGYDFVLDAIDSLQNKCLLLAGCRERGIAVLACGGAGGRRDPTQVRVADLALASHDRLLRQARKRLRTDFGFPRDETQPFGVDCVYSTEDPVFPRADGSVCTSRQARDTSIDLQLNCNGGYGTASFVTGAFGFAAAARIAQRLAENSAE